DVMLDLARSRQLGRNRVGHTLVSESVGLEEPVAYHRVNGSLLVDPRAETTVERGTHMRAQLRVGVARNADLFGHGDEDRGGNPLRRQRRYPGEARLHGRRAAPLNHDSRLQNLWLNRSVHVE